jgi:HEPN domain-containing protein
VNHAFAVELVLKLLHVIVRGTAAKGHDLERLYAELPDSVKAKMMRA